MRKPRRYAGYKMYRYPGHPLADKYGRVHEHRKVLYDKLGEGPHRCHWCQGHVVWRSDDYGLRLAADHLDGNPTNNDPDNLVPAHVQCNRHREAWYGAA